MKLSRITKRRIMKKFNFNPKKDKHHARRIRAKYDNRPETPGAYTRSDGATVVLDPVVGVYWNGDLVK